MPHPTQHLRFGGSLADIVCSINLIYLLTSYLPGDHRVQVWWRSGHLPASALDITYSVSKPDRQWRNSSFQESKKVRVSRDLWPWPWPWAHPGCMLTWSPSCERLVAIGPFAWEKKRFSCQHKSARITWPSTLTLSTSWMHADLESILWKFGGDPATLKIVCEKKQFAQKFTDGQTDRQTDRQTTDTSPLH